jgi:hypothetical protein
MSTLKLSIVATTVFAAAAFSFAQTGSGPSAARPNTSKRPGSETTKWETGVLALAGALAVQMDENEEEARAPEAATADFSVEGMFVDVCCCMPPCPCEVTQVAMGCRGVGAHQIGTGKYAGDDLSGVKIAHAKVVRSG